MSDSKEDSQEEEKNKLRLKAPHRLVLNKKTVEEGSIKQSFAHGRSKSVVVEVRRKKTFLKNDDELQQGLSSAKREEKEAALQEMLKREGSLQGSNKNKHQVLRPMSEEERDAFQRVAEEKQQKELEERQRQEREQQARELARQQALAAEEEARRLKASREAAESKPAATVAPPPPVTEAPKPAVQAQPAELPVVEKVVTAPAEKAPPVARPTVISRPEQRSMPAARTAEAAGRPEKGRREDAIGRQGTGPAPRAPAMAEGRPGAGKPGPGTGRPQGKTEGPVGRRGEGQARPQREAVAATAPAPAPVPADATAEAADGDKGGSRKKLTRAQREEVARKKVEDLVALRLAQLEELREQKRRDDLKRLSETEGEKNRKLVKAKPLRAKEAEVVEDVHELGIGPAPRIPRGGGGGRGRSHRRIEHLIPQPIAPQVRDVVVPETITVSELANRMAVKSSEVIKLLFKQGMMVTINQVLDQDTAVLVVEELGHKPKAVSEEAAIQAELADSVDLDGTLVNRPPVVTVMGHVDHGKTSLLDAIRRTDIASREFGGITQHIGAYQVTLTSGARITFLDTPGHAAFTAMRARGAKATDVVVLVVAADDGVMPQTIEAINHARDAKVPIVVAINKIDKPSANPDRVMQQLSDMELVPEAWGGETIFVPVSAKTGEGLETLQEMILLQAEVLDLRANPDKSARGVIVEAKLDRGRGAVATCLVQNGTLHVGDIFVVGSEWGKIRGLLNDKGESVQEAMPAMPVEIIGLSGVPQAGIELIVVPDERRAREIATFYYRKQREKDQVMQQNHTNLGDLFNQIRQGDINEIRVVLKGDVQGSVEAVSDALLKITHPEVRVVVIHTGVGGITESDIMLAVASDAVVIGFNVRADVKARALAKQEGIDLRFYNVIYNVVDDLTKALEGKLRPTITENILGQALVREVFRISKVGNIAGCVITQGMGQRNAKVRVLRDHVVVYEGTITTLRHYKEDIKEIKEGQECGIALERFNDFRPRDIMEFYILEEVRQTIS